MRTRRVSLRQEAEAGREEEKEEESEMQEEEEVVVVVEGEAVARARTDRMHGTMTCTDLPLFRGRHLLEPEPGTPAAAATTRQIVAGAVPIAISSMTRRGHD